MLDNNKWYIIGAIAIIIIIIIIFFAHPPPKNTNKTNNTNQTNNNIIYDNGQVMTNNITVLETNPTENQTQNVDDIDKTIAKYFNFENFNNFNNIYEHFDNVLDISLNNLDTSYNLSNKLLIELYKDLLLNIPQKIKNKLVCIPQYDNKLLIKQNVLCILSQFFYWWIDQINIPDNSSIIEKNMLLILLILFLINDNKMNITDIMNYDSNKKSITIISYNLHKFLENILNINIRKYLNKQKDINIKPYHLEFSVKNENDQENFKNKVKSITNNSTIKQQKNPTIKFKTTNDLKNKLNENVISINDKFKLLNDILNYLNMSINNKIFSNNDATELRNKIKDIKNKIIELNKNTNKNTNTNTNINTNKHKNVNDISKNQRICTLDFNPVCGVDNKTYTNSCNSPVDISYNGACKTSILIEEINKIMIEIENIQIKIFNIINDYNNKPEDNQLELFDSNIILPSTISISDLIKIFKKVFILSRSSTDISCNCIYSENYDFKFVHIDYITNYLI